MNRLILQFTADLHLKGYAPNSIQNHRLDLLKFQAWLGQAGEVLPARVREMTTADITDYKHDLARQMKPRSVNRHLSSLKLFYRFLESVGLAATNPVDGVSFPKVFQESPAMLTPGEVTALLDAVDESRYLGLRDRAILELLYSCGLKLNELMGLNVDSPQLDLGFLRVGGRKHRMVPLTPRATALLGRYIQEARAGRLRDPLDPCLFPGRNGSRISRVGVWKLVKKHAEAAGIRKNFNPRGLRHAFAIHLILGGMDLDGIRFLFGYRKLEAADLYAHVNTPDFRETYRACHPVAHMPTARPESP
ncbi:MAG: tyrosine-type recombinase/integrase [Deltaproteobacteria bacterium]|nr:tyrosine-type recombinase/integrase [Deltaproteobacteria bacterium]